MFSADRPEEGRRDRYWRRKQQAQTRRSLTRRARVLLTERAERGPWLSLRLSPSAVGLATGGWAAFKQLGSGRGIVRGWTPKSRRNLMAALSEIEWPEGAQFVFLSPTYPAVFPSDPAVFKAHLKAFRAAWERRFGPAFAVWAQEFQRRGAVHFHIVILAPPGVRIELLRRWFALTWHRVATGCGRDPLGGLKHGQRRRAAAARGTAQLHDRGQCASDPKHLEHHLAPEPCKLATSPTEAATYLVAELGKERQKSLPAYLDDPADGSPPRGAGRWWGIWRFKRVQRHLRLPQRLWHSARRVARRIARRLMARSRARLASYRAVKVARGERWTPPARAPAGDWTAPRHTFHGLAVRDPEFRPWLYAREMEAFVASTQGAARGSFLALDRALPQQLTMGWA